MNTVTLGKSNLTVSEMCLGTMFFGIKISEEESFRLMDFYYEQGGRFFDTANKYSTWIPGFPEPVGEYVVGRWINSRGCRNEVILSTKLGFPYLDVPRGLTKNLIISEVDKSLQRLNISQLDILYAHADDYNTPIEETLEAFHSLIKAGKVRALGNSNFYTWRTAQSNSIAAANGWTPYCCSQMRLSILWPKVNAKFGNQVPATEELLDYSTRENLSVLCYSPLLQGFFGRDDRDLPGEYDTPQNIEICDLIQNEANQSGVSGNVVVLAWMLEQGFIPLITGSRKEQIQENLSALSFKLSAEASEKINNLYYPNKTI